WWPDQTYQFGGNDGCYSDKFHGWEPGWHTYYFDLTTPNGDAGVRHGSWTSGNPVRGFSIHPSAEAAPGTQFKMDWIRLSDPSKSPEVAIRWNATGAGSDDVVNINVSDSADGQGGSVLMRGIPAKNGEYALKTSI